MKLRSLKWFTLVCVFLLSSGSLGMRAETKRDEAWDILKANLNEKGTEKRAVAVYVLGLLPGDRQAMEFAQKAATDEKPEVRAAAATALGHLQGKSSIAVLHKLLSDSEPSVVLAAASALITSKDPAAYEAYYEFLTGERKTNKGLIAEQMKMLKDPKKIWRSLALRRDWGSYRLPESACTHLRQLSLMMSRSVRAAAAKMLANDPDPESGKALVEETSDKSWLGKTAALEAIAKRGDPQLLDGILTAMTDDNTSVRCTAAAAVIRLSTLAGSAGKK